MTAEDQIILRACELTPAFDLFLASGPGPFERCERPVLAAAIRAIDLNGLADEALADDKFGLSGCCVDRFVLLTDEQGFHTLIKCPTPEAAYLKLVGAFGVEEEGGAIRRHGREESR